MHNDDRSREASLLTQQAQVQPPHLNPTIHQPYIYSKMADQNIKQLFNTAESRRKSVESSSDSNTAIYQQNLEAAIASYNTCHQLADQLSLFSPNETLEDIASGDLQ